MRGHQFAHESPADFSLVHSSASFWRVAPNVVEAARPRNRRLILWERASSLNVAISAAPVALRLRKSPYSAARATRSQSGMVHCWQ
jgi:hypothetical protein